MPVEAHELETGMRYFYRCPVCSEVSLPFKDEAAAANESGRHLGCAAKRR